MICEICKAFYGSLDEYFSHMFDCDVKEEKRT